MKTWVPLATVGGGTAAGQTVPCQRRERDGLARESPAREGTIETSLVNNLSLRRQFLGPCGDRLGIQQPLQVDGGQPGQSRERDPSHGSKMGAGTLCRGFVSSTRSSCRRGFMRGGCHGAFAELGSRATSRAQAGDTTPNSMISWSAITVPGAVSEEMPRGGQRSAGGWRTCLKCHVDYFVALFRRGGPDTSLQNLGFGRSLLARGVE